MGVFDKIKSLFTRSDKKKQVQDIINTYYGGNWQYFVWNYANQIYNIPEVKCAIEKIADIFSSVDIYNERVDKNGNIQYLEDATNRILKYKPNPLQNATQFYKNVITKLLLDNNVFIEPVFDMTGNLKALYPLPTMNFQLSMDNNDKNAYVQFYDAYKNPQEKYNLNNIIYLNRFNTLSGGQQSNDMGLYEKVLQSLSEKIVNDASPNKPRALLQSNQIGEGQLKDKDKKGATETLKASFAENVQGIAYLDKKWTITPINWNENDVNKELMAFIVNLVYNYFSINENIINNKASEIEMAMFVKTTIKPLAKQFSQEFTNKLFTENEYNFGRRIEFDYNPLLVTTLQSEANIAQINIRNGIWSIDEARERIGYEPLPDGLGKVHRASADLVNIKVIDDYELGKVGRTKSVSATENVSHETNLGEDINKNKEDSNGTDETK